MADSEIQINPNPIEYEGPIKAPLKNHGPEDEAEDLIKSEMVVMVPLYL